MVSVKWKSMFFELKISVKGWLVDLRVVDV